LLGNGTEGGVRRGVDLEELILKKERGDFSYGKKTLSGVGGIYSMLRFRRNWKDFLRGPRKKGRIAQAGSRYSSMRRAKSGEKRERGKK